MAGYTPFQFSSNKLQYDRSFGSNSGALGNTANALLAWYDMWINPDSVTIDNSYKQTVTHTAGSIVTHHYRKDVGSMNVSGSIGWVAIKSLLEETRDTAMQALLSFDAKKMSEAGAGLQSKYEKKLADIVKNPFGNGKTSNLNNSPRIFLERLKDLADQPMYYMDSDGIEHYNVKYIKVFTKQYPSGVVLEGYFKSFQVPESSDDSQTIKYSFNFVIENQRPITLVESIGGMFADYGSVVGDGVSLIKGLI